MTYCPHCTERLTKPTKVCPHCKKLIDLSLHAALYQPGETSKLNRRALRKIWMAEHSHIITPILTFISGCIVGGIALFFYSQQSFVDERQSYATQIDSLKTVIESQEAAAGSLNDGFAHQLAGKDTIIVVLEEQRETLSKMLSFTARLARNSTISADSSEAQYFRRNFRYLETQMEQQQEKLDKTGHKAKELNNLASIPQLLK